MTRDCLATEFWLDQWIAFRKSSLRLMAEQASVPSKNPAYRPQFLRDLAVDHLQMILCCYSRGDQPESLKPYFDDILNYLELAENESKSKTEGAVDSRREKAAQLESIDQYIQDFWIVSLAVVFDVPEKQWMRVCNVIRTEEDELLDRFIFQRSPNRPLGTRLCYPKPYAKLLKAIDAPRSQQARLLCSFLDAWYTELGEVASPAGRGTRGPSWHRYHSPMKGAYFGYWCLEAVAAVKLFQLDDGLCVGHPHYPGDLLRPGRITFPDVDRLEPELASALHRAERSVPSAEPQQISWWQGFKMLVKSRWPF